MMTLKYNVKMEKIHFPLLSLLLVCEQLYEKTIIFYYIVFKIHFKMLYYTDLNIKKFCTKMTALPI